MSKILKKGQPVYLSTVGHNNFVYPAKEKQETVLVDSQAKELSFVGGGSCSAYLVDSSAFYSSNALQGRKIVVWIDKHGVGS